MKAINYFIVLVTVLIVAFIGFRIFTPEDNWICQNGTWLKHGNPSQPMPSTPCIKKSTSTNESTKSSDVSTQEKNISKKYTSTKFGFSTKYPNGVDVKENIDGTITFSKWGPTQKTQTELFDGFSINIDQGSLGSNKNLQSLIAADIEQKNEQLSPDFKVIETVSPKYGGYTYKSQEIVGDVSYFYLPQKSDKFLLITVSLKDPGKLDFAKTVEDIISSISMAK